MEPSWTYQTLAAKLAHSACISSGEWLLALTALDLPDDDSQAIEDMEQAAGLFAEALVAFDALACGPDDLRRRREVEHLRSDVVDILQADGVAAFFDPDAADIVRQPLDLAPHAAQGEVRQ